MNCLDVERKYSEALVDYCNRTNIKLKKYNEMYKENRDLYIKNHLINNCVLECIEGISFCLAKIRKSGPELNENIPNLQKEIKERFELLDKLM